MENTSYLITRLGDFTTTRSNRVVSLFFQFWVKNVGRSVWMFCIWCISRYFFLQCGISYAIFDRRTETNAINITSNSTNSSTPSPTARTCHHGLFYSLDCPESQNGKYFWSEMHKNDFSVICKMCPFCFVLLYLSYLILFILSNWFLCHIGMVAEALTLLYSNDKVFNGISAL